MEKVFRIPLKEPRDYFRSYLGLVSPFPPVSSLGEKEKDLLAYLMYLIRYYYAGLPEDEIIKLVYHKDTKKMIKKDLGVNDAVFNNLMSFLRKKGVITSGGMLMRALDIDFDPDFKLSFIFEIPQEQIYESSSEQ